MSATSRDGAGWPGSNDRGEERCPRMMMLKKNSRLFRVFAQRAQEAAAPDAPRPRAFMALKQRDRNLLLKYRRCLPPRVVALRPALVRGSAHVPCKEVLETLLSFRL